MRIITAPSNLGLRPIRPGHEPGGWRAPEALIRAGLLDATDPDEVVELPRPTYSAEPQTGTRLLNGTAMRAFNLRLAREVAAAVRDDQFAFVVGGDCSVLLGALAGVRRSGPVSLVHVDGHSDFRHPGNYDPEASLGAVAGLDLALATGRGEVLGTEWPDAPAPLVEDRFVVQLGEREGRDADFAWPDVRETDINLIEVFEALALGPARVLERVRATVDRTPDRSFWVHLDVDVLDQAIMPAVDSPGSPGLSPDDLVAILSPLVADQRCLGMTLTVFDPDLDSDGACAATIIDIVRRLEFRS